VPYGSCVFATWEWCVLHRSCMGAMCPCGGHMVPNRRWMVPFVSCMQHIGAPGTMWEPYGSCVGRMGGGWCHAPSAGHMGTMCTVREVDGLWEPCGAIWETDGTILEADGAIWEQRAQYGVHIVVVSLCGSRVHCMGAVCTVWTPCMPYGSHMEPNGRRMGGSRVPYGSHWHHMGAVWKLCGPHQRWMAPYGTCWHRMGAMWEPSVPCSRQMAYGIHVVPHGSHMAPCGRWMGSYGSCMAKWGHMRAMCTLLETAEPDGRIVHHVGAASTVREL
jgi:hypothetical protein